MWWRLEEKSLGQMSDSPANGDTVIVASSNTGMLSVKAPSTYLYRHMQSCTVVYPTWHIITTPLFREVFPNKWLSFWTSALVQTTKKQRKIKLYARGAHTCVWPHFCCHDLDINPMTSNSENVPSHWKLLSSNDWLDMYGYHMWNEKVQK